MDRQIDQYVSNCHLFIEKFNQGKKQAEAFSAYIKNVENFFRRKRDLAIRGKCAIEERSILVKDITKSLKEVEHNVDRRFSANNQLLEALDDMTSGIDSLVHSQIQRCQDRRVLVNEIERVEKLFMSNLEAMRGEIRKDDERTLIASKRIHELEVTLKGWDSEIKEIQHNCSTLQSEANQMENDVKIIETESKLTEKENIRLSEEYITLKNNSNRIDECLEKLSDDKSISEALKSNLAALEKLTGIPTCSNASLEQLQCMHKEFSDRKVVALSKESKLIIALDIERAKGRDIEAEECALKSQDEELRIKYETTVTELRESEQKMSSLQHDEDTVQLQLTETQKSINSLKANIQATADERHAVDDSMATAKGNARSLAMDVSDAIAQLTRASNDKSHLEKQHDSFSKLLSMAEMLRLSSETLAQLTDFVNQKKRDSIEPEEEATKNLETEVDTQKALEKSIEHRLVVTREEIESLKKQVDGTGVHGHDMAAIVDQLISLDNELNEKQLEHATCQGQLSADLDRARADVLSNIEDTVSAEVRKKFVEVSRDIHNDHDAKLARISMDIDDAIRGCQADNQSALQSVESDIMEKDKLLRSLATNDQSSKIGTTKSETPSRFRRFGTPSKAAAGRAVRPLGSASLKKQGGSPFSLTRRHRVPDRMYSPPAPPTGTQDSIFANTESAAITQEPVNHGITKPVAQRRALLIGSPQVTLPALGSAAKTRLIHQIDEEPEDDLFN